MDDSVSCLILSNILVNDQVKLISTLVDTNLSESQRSDVLNLLINETETIEKLIQKCIVIPSLNIIANQLYDFSNDEIKLSIFDEGVEAANVNRITNTAKCLYVDALTIKIWNAGYFYGQQVCALDELEDMHTTNEVMSEIAEEHIRNNPPKDYTDPFDIDL